MAILISLFANPHARSKNGLDTLRRTDWKEPVYLDTLAAAYAEKSDSEEAENW